MLGSLRLRHQGEWQWAAYGKHPAVKDYFTVGRNSPLVKGFSEWVETGYNMIAPRKHGDGTAVSWRFWGRGPGEGGLVCGIVRDNRDSLGRPYPLLILGTGSLEKWENHWNLMPFACERAWTDMEYLSTHIFDDLKRLEGELKNLRQPAAEWAGFTEAEVHSREIAKGDPGSASLVMPSMEELAAGAPDTLEWFLPIDDRWCNDQFSFIVQCHSFIKAQGGVTPSFVFLGGTLTKSYLFCLRRAVKPGDFVRMWSDFSGLATTGGPLVAP